MAGFLGYRDNVGRQPDSQPATARVLVGNYRWMVDNRVAISPEAAEFRRDQEDAARTCVMMAVDGVLAGALGVVDPLKAEARGVVTALRVLGLHVHLVTGDNEATANAVGRQLGLDSVKAEVLPQGKVEYVRGL